MFVQLLLLCVAVSMDGLGAGFSYGVRNLRIPFLSLVVISLSSALTMGLAMFLGWTFKHFVPLYLARFLGGGILIVLGCWIVWQGMDFEQKNILKRRGRHRHKEVDSEGHRHEKVDNKGHKYGEVASGRPDLAGQATDQTAAPVETLRLRYLHYLPKVIFEPQIADLDHSGIISLGEAALLGMALACDAFGAGFAAALSGFNLWLTTSAVGLSKFIFISLGLWSGNVYGGKLSVLPANLLSGGLLIFLGLLNILWGGF